jgi:hypothetical protein
LPAAPAYLEWIGPALSGRDKARLYREAALRCIYKTDYPEIDRLWREGFDTAAIGEKLRVFESDVYNVLPLLRNLRRQGPIIIRQTGNRPAREQQL